MALKTVSQDELRALIIKGACERALATTVSASEIPPYVSILEKLDVRDDVRCNWQLGPMPEGTSVHVAALLLQAAGDAAKTYRVYQPVLGGSACYIG